MGRWPQSLHFLPACNNTVRKFNRGISLHGHTQHSRESLGFLNHHIDTVPIVAQIARVAMARYEREHGETLDFNRAFWTAPVSAGDAYELEKQQIEDHLGLEGTVSMTDHDTIDGALDRQGDGRQGAVVSLEWTVPYRAVYFHLGVHNLPRAQARALTGRLLAYTQSPDEQQLGELLAMLDQISEVLVVLNHPFWEMEPIGKAALFEMLQSFTRSYGRYIHALEVNGLRPWRENQQVLQMAEDLGLAVVSGGDRHGCEANAMLNITRARSFSEFVAEVRQDGQSEIVVMPSYQKEPYGLRIMQVAWDILREYPTHPCGRVHWTDRVFFECADGVVRPIARCFRADVCGELQLLTGAMRQLEWQPWRTMLHAAWSLHPSNHALPPHRVTSRPAARPAFSTGDRSAI
jgi:hypothetical protein